VVRWGRCGEVYAERRAAAGSLREADGVWEILTVRDFFDLAVGFWHGVCSFFQCVSACSKNLLLSKACKNTPGFIFND
jgi:hypothetical protein